LKHIALFRIPGICRSQRILGELPEASEQSMVLHGSPTQHHARGEMPRFARNCDT
jgi:hypothetical protein